MSTVKIPPVLRQAVGGERTVEAPGSTMGEVLTSPTGNEFAYAAAAPAIVCSLSLKPCRYSQSPSSMSQSTSSSS